MTRRLRDAIALNLAAGFGWHLLTGAARLYASLQGTPGPVPERLVDRAIASYLDYDRRNP